MYKFESTNNYLFIGAIGDDTIVAKLNNQGCNVSSAYNMQRKILDGLEKLGYYCDTITGHISPPNKFKNLIINYKSKKRNDKVDDISVSYINLPLINRIIKRYKIGRAAKCWIKNRRNAYVFVYSLNSSFLLGALDVKKRRQDSKVIAIVPDLPEFMSNNQSRLYLLLKKLDRKIINYCLKKIDGFVLFSEMMKEKLPMKGKPYVVVEGIIRDVEHEEYIKKVETRIKNPEKIFMLSGALDYQEGIETLLKTFSKMKNSNYKLWLTGTGNAVDLINKYVSTDKRIAYFGYIASYKEFSELQQKATVFVLMVPPTHPKAPYYFPSKLLEYLVTGGIVVCYKLPCIPSEYDEYLHYFSGNADQIGKQLTELCEMDSETYRKIALKRYDFIKQKNSVEQMKKVENLIGMLQ